MTTYPKSSDPVSAFTRADGTSEAHSIDHGRVIGIWENVKHHGATGNGTTNDSTAIQAAITAVTSSGGTVFFPPGTYALSSGLTLAANVTLRGAAHGGSTLKHNAGSSALITLSGSGLAPSGVAVHDLTLLGGTGTGDGIQINGTSGANISGVHLDNLFFDGLDGSYGIKATWALETTIHRCSFRHQAGIGIGLIKSSNASIIRDCIMSNSGDGTNAIVLTDSASSETLIGVTITGCVIEAWRGTYGVYVNGVGPVRIRDCHFEDNRGTDILVDSPGGDYSHDITIDSNHFSPDASQTNVIDLTCLNAVLLNNDISTKAVALTTAGGGNSTYYTLIGNRFVSGAAVTDSTTANQDVVTLIGNRGLSATLDGAKLSPSVHVLVDRGIRLTESSDPSAPATNNVVIYAKDTGGGKTTLVARFPTGGVQTIATEP